MQAAVDIEEASEVTANGILLIAQHTGRWAKMARCFGYEPGVEEALTDLYVQVLGFVLPAMRHLHKGPWGKLFNNPNSHPNYRCFTEWQPCVRKTGEITPLQCEPQAQHKAL